MNVVAYVLNDCLLRVGTEVCRIVEVEYYSDPDPFIHGASEQKTAHCWYFHKANPSTPGPTGFRSGTYKGLDFTIGSASHSASILLRSIEVDGKIIEGPCKVVNYILQVTQCSSIEHLVGLSSSYPPSALDVTFPLHIEGTVPGPREIFHGPRVGLTLKHELYTNGPRTQYVMKPYRCTTVPSKLSKYKCLLALHYLTNHNFDQTTNIFGKFVSRWSYSAIQGHSSVSLNLETVSGLCQAYGYLSSRGFTSG